jgi:small basic protein (TIGR04137 family)
MSLDKSLKTKASLERHRNVLSRAERIEKLKDADRWEEGRSPFGLPKVAHRKAAVGGKAKKKAKAEGEGEGAEGAEAKPEAEKEKKEKK